jgi:hypothetical protein
LTNWPVISGGGMTRRNGWLVLAMVGLSCGAPTDGCGCLPALAGATIIGRVTSTGGAPVQNATIFAYAADANGCVRRADADGVGQSGADGSYRLSIGRFDSPDPICVLVAFRAPVGSSLGTPPDTTMTLGFRFSPPLDSARADAIFPSRTRS